MKILEDHLDHLRGKIVGFLKSNPDFVKRYETGDFARADKVKDLQKRFCFDVMYCSGLTPFIADTLYTYMDDTHVYTALKCVCPKVTRKY